MTYPIPDKFQDLSPTQVEEFARIGFAFFRCVCTQEENRAKFDSLFQKITEPQQELIKAINSSVTKIKN